MNPWQRFKDWLATPIRLADEALDVEWGDPYFDTITDYRDDLEWWPNGAPAVGAAMAGPLAKINVELLLEDIKRDLGIGSA